MIANIIVGAILLVIVALAVRSLWKGRKSGCGCGCENCAKKGICHPEP